MKVILSAQQAKFKLEFFLLMQAVGRDDEANDALRSLMEWLDRQILMEDKDE